MTVITFKKPYVFEGKEYTEIDLSSLENLSTAQLVKIERQFEKSGAFSALKELNLEYCLTVASVVTGLPMEFFLGLPARDSQHVKQEVSNYFFG